MSEPEFLIGTQEMLDMLPMASDPKPFFDLHGIVVYINPFMPKNELWMLGHDGDIVLRIIVKDKYKPQPFYIKSQ